MTGKKAVYCSPIARNYYQLLPYVFKRFSILTARRTLVPTLSYYLQRKALPPSDKPALFTMNILPPMMTVWYHFVRKYLGSSVDVTIFDCSGKLDPREFPGARVQKFLNLYAAAKSDEFLYHIAKHRRIGWICDDDVFLINSQIPSIIEQELRIPGTATVSFRPRSWWHFNIQGKEYPVSGSYCIAFNRNIFVDKEKLSLAPAPENHHPSDIGKPPVRYDTGDKANEELIRRGYRCTIVPEAESDHCIAAFTGMSGAVMLLYYFTNKEQVMDYFLSPPKQQWSGNVLFGTLASMLAICTIQECYERLTGQTYPIRSLPSRRELEKIRKDHTSLFRSDQSFDWVDRVSERLHAAL